MQVHASYLYKKRAQQTWLTVKYDRRRQPKTTIDQSNLAILVTCG